MKTTHFRRFSAAMAVVIMAGWESAAFGAHERLHAITTRNDLISFYSDAPGRILSAHAITGLQDGSEKIRGIDSSTNDHKLYGLGSSSRLYVIDPATGAATPVGSGQFSPVLNGQSFGVDNGPSGFHVASDLSQSLVIDRATGAASLQPSLAFAVGGSAIITALAYDDATGNWYAGDSVRNSFATLNPSTGVLTTIGAAGIDFSRENGLDISPSTGIMYLASPASSSDPQSNLYTVNKANGNVTLVGLIGNPGDNFVLRGLAVAAP
jgi:hypothetical protein